MLTIEALETVVRMAKDRGGFRSAEFTTDETQALKDVEELIESYIDDDYGEDEYIN